MQTSRARTRSALGAYATKAELVYQHLRSAIVSGDYSPGDRLVVDQIAQDLGVSKVPVREAVTRLVGEGWVQLQPHVGPVVPELSPSEIEETAVIRAALESTAIRLAMTHADDELVSSLKLLLRQMDAAVSDPRRDFPSANRAFHTMAISACPFPRLTQMAEAMMERTIRYQTVRRVPAYLEASQSEHHAIWNAIATGDGDQAATLTHSHILTGAEALRRQIAGG